MLRVLPEGGSGSPGGLTPFFPMFGSVRQIGLTGFSIRVLIVGLMLLRHARGPEGPTAGQGTGASGHRASQGQRMIRRFTA